MCLYVERERERQGTREIGDIDEDTETNGSWSSGGRVREIAKQ